MLENVAVRERDASRVKVSDNDGWPMFVTEVMDIWCPWLEIRFY